MSPYPFLIATLAFALVSTPLQADRILDGKDAQKQEVRHSMVGFRNTLIFYKFKEQKAILTILIDNTDETFPVTGKILLFDETTTEEGMDKWINNQHSDGLFPDVPEPVFTAELPKESCKVTSHKKKDTSPNPTGQGTFQNYEVEFSIKDHAVDKQFKISAFTDTAQVHIKQP